MRRPSDNLMRLLTTLNLATEQEVDACAPIVKRLCQNLPEFDSVWVDALVQRRIITPWQAGVLGSATPERLRVGEYRKTEQLGANTFHAVSVETSRQVVLQTFTDQTHGSQLLRQLPLLSQATSPTPASVECPRTVLTKDGADATSQDANGYVASTFVPGWTAKDLLIRGGRIPWPAVAEIGLQLLRGLSWLEAQETVHGDVALHTVRLRPTGDAVLVSAFTNPLAYRGVSLTANLRLQDVAHMAPERVGSGLAANSRSELYSLGCVLWELLTARPAFLSADPVSKVLKSQEADVDDVRSLVPDCPDWLARQLQSMTRRSPELRTASFAEAYRQWNQHSAPAVRQTRRLLKRLPDRSLRLAANRSRASIMSSRVTKLVTVSVMVAAFAAFGIQRGLIPHPLAVASPSRVKTLSEEVAGQSPHAADTASIDPHASLTMPEPDAAGVVVLQSGTSYTATDINYAGVMHIETTGDAVALVRVSSQQPWRISADQIVMRNVEVRIGQSDEAKTVPNASPLTAVVCECDVLALKRCRIDSGRGGTRDRGLYWRPRAGLTSVVSISDTVFHGSGYGIWMSSLPKRCEVDNLLVRTDRAALRFDVTSVGTANINLKATAVTQVSGISFLDAVVHDADCQKLQVRVTFGESVLAVTTGLIQIASPEAWPLQRAEVECLLPERGNPTIVPPGVLTAVGFDAGLNSVVALQDSQIRVEALLIANPVFRTDRSLSTTAVPDAAFELTDYEGPKLSQQLPGVELSKLPPLFSRNSF